MSPSSGKSGSGIDLDEEALGRIADGLARLYRDLYEEQALEPRVSLADELLTFAFSGGLLPADEKLLEVGREERLREFRDQFFEVVSDEFAAEVGRLTETDVATSFHGFDGRTLTTYLIFVLDLSGRAGSEARRTDLGWSGQVRGNADRRDGQHAEGEEARSDLRDRWRGQQETMGRGGGDSKPSGGSER